MTENKSPYSVPYDYVKTEHYLYLPDTTGEHGYWDDNGYPCSTFSMSHGRLDAPDQIPSGSMLSVLVYDYPWDRHIFIPSVTVRGK